jgi:hypothetical protein
VEDEIYSKAGQIHLPLDNLLLHSQLSPNTIQCRTPKPPPHLQADGTILVSSTHQYGRIDDAGSRVISVPNEWINYVMTQNIEWVNNDVRIQI